MTGRRILREVARLSRRIYQLRLDLATALDAGDEAAVAEAHAKLEDAVLALRALQDRGAV